jgi:hypothetical protein
MNWFSKYPLTILFSPVGNMIVDGERAYVLVKNEEALDVLGDSVKQIGLDLGFCYPRPQELRKKPDLVELHDFKNTGTSDYNSIRCCRTIHKHWDVTGILIRPISNE